MRVYTKKIKVFRASGELEGTVKAIINHATQENKVGDKISSIGVHAIITESDNNEYRSQLSTIYPSDIEGLCAESELRLREYLENKLNGVKGLSAHSSLLANGFECSDTNIQG